jgi:hypothetical protein
MQSNPAFAMVGFSQSAITQFPTNSVRIPGAMKHAEDNHTVIYHPGVNRIGEPAQQTPPQVTVHALIRHRISSRSLRTGIENT